MNGIEENVKRSLQNIRDYQHGFSHGKDIACMS
jgi:hypothetical protein